MRIAHILRSAATTGLILLSPEISATETYLCIAEHVAGFRFDKGTGEWEGGHSKSDSKYVMSRSTEEGFVWVVKEVGSASLHYKCENDFSKGGTITCHGFGGDFRMNKKNLRFMETYWLGYWLYDIFNNGSKEGDDTPSMEIGKCSPL